VTAYIKRICMLNKMSISGEESTENWDNERFTMLFHVLLKILTTKIFSMSRPSTSKSGLYKVLNPSKLETLSPLAYHQILDEESKTLNYSDARLGFNFLKS
jgi:hypothetical protein